MAKRLTEKQLAHRAKSVPGWQLNKQQTELSRTFKFDTYIKGLSFIARIAVHAEILDHHPYIEFTLDSVKVRLKTHALKGLTTVDFDLAKRIDNLKY